MKKISVQELDAVTFGYDNKKIGEVNPFRYRGYYYDTETGFYYLNSRYYDPQVKRFINADAYASTGQGFNGTNMFCYCLNNPVNNADYGGTEAILIAALGLLITGLAAAVTAIVAGNLIEGAVNGVCDLLVEVIDEVVSSATGTSAPPSSYGSYDTGYAANAPSGYASTSSISYAAAQQRLKDGIKDISKSLSRPPDDSSNYWSVDLIHGRMVVTSPLTVQEACFRVSQRGNVLCRNEAAAR